jgi:prepilin-type N-terminal cleavage/methylation domain-containing protein
MKRRANDGAQAGVSLVELLVSISILGVAFVAILGAVSANFAADDLHRQLTTADTWLRRYGEAVHAAPYVACARPVNYRPALDPAPPPGFARRLVSVEYWDGNATAAFGGSRAACISAGDTGIQRVTIRVTTAGRARPVAETLVIFKRTTP